jgi:CDP-diacylglycerol--glycerol-3-phosphate 3-phosphatidyltransferase
VPVLVALLLVRHDATDVFAAIVFAVGGWTDLLDGYLARRWKVSTPTGAWLDPLADKLLVGAPVITLVALGRFPVWAAVIILAREVAVTGIRIYLGTRGRGMPASGIAKWKTLAQLLAIFLYILPLSDAWSPLQLTVLIVAVALTVYTGIDYLVTAMRWVRAPSDAPPPPPARTERPAPDTEGRSA